MKKNLLKLFTIFFTLIFTSTNILFAQQLLEGDSYNIVVPDINSGKDFLVNERGDYEILGTLGQAFSDPRMYSDSYSLDPDGPSFEPNVPEVGCFETTTERGQLPISEGLVLHLDADDIEGLEDGNPVETWGDLSTEENDAVQATAGNRPIYKTNILNGKSIVRFNHANSQFMEISDGILNFAGTPTFFIVTTNITLSGQHGILGGSAHSSRGAIYFSNVADQQITYTSTSPRLGNVVNPQIYSAIEGDAVYQNGNNLFSIGTYSPNPNTIYIGYQPGIDSPGYMTGDIAEIIIYDQALSTEEREEVEQYLGTKWLDWEPPTPTCSTGPSYLNEYGMVRVCGPNGCYNRARFEIDAQGNPSDTLYGIQVSTDNFTEDIRYVDGITSMLKDEKNINDYKTKADWENTTFNLLGLEPETEYSLRITALYGNLTESVPSASASATTALSTMSFRIGLGYEDGENINYNSPHEIIFDESFQITRGANVISSDRLIWTLINTNSANGVSVVQKGEHGGLYNDDVEYTITSVTGDLDIQTEGIGLKNSYISQLYNDNGTQGSLSTLVPEVEYDSETTNSVGLIDTIFKKTYESNGPIHTGETSLGIKTKASLATPEGNYFEDITFVLIAKY